MPSWRETIRLEHPLTAVQVAIPVSLAAALRAQAQDRFDEGREAGERDLSAQLLQQRSELLSIQNGLFQSLRSAIPDLIQTSEKSLAILAFEVAHKVVAECPVSLETVEAVIRETLSTTEAASDLVLHVNAEDFAMLQHANSPLLVEAASGERLRFQISSEVPRGGCILHTPFGIIDARRNSKFEILKENLQP
jgi:flagellar assembly protein FliH